jgi:hypothetical protein
LTAGAQGTESDDGQDACVPFRRSPSQCDEGGGYLITFPDFSDCVSDGASVEERAVGVSLNTLVVSLLSEGLGKKAACA